MTEQPQPLQLKRLAPDTSPAASAPDRGKAPRLSMGPGGTCNTATDACDRVDMGGGWADFGSYRTAREPDREVQLYGKAETRLGSICLGESCRAFAWPSDLPFERSSGAIVVGLFFDTVVPVCVIPSIRSIEADKYFVNATDAAKTQLAGQTFSLRDLVHVRYADSGVYSFTVGPNAGGGGFVLQDPKKLATNAATPCKR